MIPVYLYSIILANSVQYLNARMASSSSTYSAVYMVPRGGASVGLDDKIVEGEESFPLLEKRKNSDSTRPSNRASVRDNREKMVEAKTPGLNESVQDFKAREDRDPEGLNSDVRVSMSKNSTLTTFLHTLVIIRSNSKKLSPSPRVTTRPNISGI